MLLLHNVAGITANGVHCSSLATPRRPLCQQDGPTRCYRRLQHKAVYTARQVPVGTLVRSTKYANLLLLSITRGSLE